MPMVLNCSIVCIAECLFGNHFQSSVRGKLPSLYFSKVVSKKICIFLLTPLKVVSRKVFEWIEAKNVKKKN